MAVYDRVLFLHRDDVAFHLLVDLVDQRRERGALPRAGRPGHEHEPTRPLGELRHHRRQAELFERAHVEGNLPDHERHAAPLLETVAAEPRQVLDPEREVELALRLEALLLVLGEHRISDRERVLRSEHVIDRRVGDVAVHAQLGPLARHDVQVRRIPLDHLLEQGAEIDRRHRAARHAAVSLTSSSRVVMPFFTLINPSIRSVSIPSLTPCSRSSSVEAPFNTMRRSADDRAITSYRPWRPLYPVPLQVSQPAPLKKGPSFGSNPKACISSGEY